MVAKSIRWLSLFAVLPLFYLAAAQPYPSSERNSNAGPDDGLRQIRNSISELKNEVRNHEAEIRAFEDRLQNQESSFDHIRQQLTDEMQSSKDYIRAASVNLEGKVAPLDASIKGLITDLRQLQTQANDSVNVLGQYKLKISELEQIIAGQNQHIKHLETALQSVMEAFQVKDNAARDIAAVRNGDGVLTYKVCSGDSLEKIARMHKVSIKALRDYNNLTNDKIIVGQTLKIPPS